jgi:ribonuclease HI
MEGSIRLYSDGLCFPQNPGGWACYGWVACGQDDQVIGQGLGCVGEGPDMTNNVAEYHAAIAALTWASEQRLRHVELYSDSQLLINQATGKWQCSSSHLRKLLEQLSTLAAETKATLKWVPRELNEHADALSRQAYFEATGQEATPQGPANIPATDKQLKYLRRLGWQGEVRNIAHASQLISELTAKTAKTRKRT